MNLLRLLPSQEKAYLLLGQLEKAVEDFPVAYLVVVKKPMLLKVQRCMKHHQKCEQTKELKKVTVVRKG